MFSGRRVRDCAFSLCGAGAVFPGEHLLGDDVGFFAYAAGEEFGGFEDGGADFAEAVAGEEGAGGGFDVVPEGGLVGEEIAGAADCLEGGAGRGFLAFGHRVPVYRSSWAAGGMAW